MSRAGGALLAALVAAWVATAGTARLPLDEHETLVAQTAREMAARRDWIVPWFNDRPRLAKPPLNYWLASAAAGFGTDVREWQARLPSILAGIGTVLVAAALGARLFGARVGRDAAWLLAASAGVFAYTHDARPEMLYTFWCSAAVLLLVVAAQAAAPAGRRRAALAMWACVGVAVLAKGPQLPAMLLVAGALWLGLARGWKAAGAVLHPLPGLALAAAIAVPWWLLLKLNLPAGTLADSQLSGTLLHPTPGALADPYYLYRPLVLLLPWLALLPLAWPALRRTRRRPAVLLVVLLCAVPALLLTLGPQKRWFYLLPALAPMGVLLALGARRLAAWRRWRPRARLPRLFWPAHVVAAGVIATLALLRAPSLAAAAGLAVVLVAAILAWSTDRRPPRAASRAGLQAAVLAFAGTWAALAAGPLLWSPSRFEKAALGTRLATTVPAATPVLAWGVTPNVFIYYGHRPIPVVDGASAIAQALRDAPRGRVIVLLPEDWRPQLPPAAIEEFGQVDDDGHGIVAVTVTRS